MDTEKQIEKLNRNLEHLTDGIPSNNDLKELFDIVLVVLEKLSNDFDQKIATNKGETDSTYREVYVELSGVKQGIKDKLRQLKENVGVDIKAVATQVINKVKELEAKIPSPTDLSSIEGRLTVLETPKPEKPENPYEARNELEAIQNEDEKLKIEAIQNLRKELDEIKKSIKSSGGRAIFGGGFNYSAMQLHQVQNEIVAGSGTAFTLANLPNPANSLQLYGRGQRLRPTTDFTVSGTNVTTVDTWSAGDIIGDYNI